MGQRLGQHFLHSQPALEKIALAVCPEETPLVVEIGPGQSFFIPRGAVHGFNNLKPTEARALAVITPALLGPEFFREAAAIVNAGGPPDVEQLKAVLLKHGLVPVPPVPS